MHVMDTKGTLYFTFLSVNLLVMDGCVIGANMSVVEVALTVGRLASLLV